VQALAQALWTESVENEIRELDPGTHANDGQLDSVLAEKTRVDLELGRNGFKRRQTKVLPLLAAKRAREVRRADADRRSQGSQTGPTIIQHLRENLRDHLISPYWLARHRKNLLVDGDGYGPSPFQVVARGTETQV